jgi:hypothetical protein
MGNIPHRRLKLIAILWSALVLLLALRASSVTGASRPTEKEAIRRLTGSGSKDWALVRFDVLLGQEDVCRKGEIWRFKQNGRLEILKCVNHRVRRYERGWKLRMRGDLDLALVVGDKEYIVFFPSSESAAAVERMRLRFIPERKATPVVDLRFTHERD